MRASGGASLRDVVKENIEFAAGSPSTLLRLRRTGGDTTTQAKPKRQTVDNGRKIDPLHHATNADLDAGHSVYRTAVWPFPSGPAPARGIPMRGAVLISNGDSGPGSALCGAGFAARAVVCMHRIFAVAIGTGAGTAVFSVVDPILFRSLPYAQADRLVSVGLVAPIIPREFMLGADYVEWRARQAPFQSITSWTGVADCDLTDTDPRV